MNLNTFDYGIIGIWLIAFVIALFKHKTIEIQDLILFGYFVIIMSNNNDIRDIKKKIEGV